MKSPRIELSAYFERIGFAGKAKADFETLEALHGLHPIAIPFENLDTLLGEPVRLDIDAVVRKLIHQHRGGYCFEQNALFLAALESIGFETVPLAARVVWNKDRGFENPRTHMALLVELDDARYLCDVGFGGATLTAPLRLATDAVQETPHEAFRIRDLGSEFVVEVEREDGWREAYEFDLQAQRAVDFEAMNHFVQTYPGSHFRTRLMAGRPDAKGRHALADNRLARYEGNRRVRDKRLSTAGELAAALTDELGIELPRHPDLPTLLDRIAAIDDD